MNKKNVLKMCSWGLAGLVSLLAIIVWIAERLEDSTVLSLYDWFPLLGLLAFSLMWTHYILGSLRRQLGVEKHAMKLYSTVTAAIVLVLILLHPGLLIYQLNKDGFGLPPQSYLTVYAEPIMKGAITLGTIALLLFLAFEFKRVFGKKSWWKYIEYAQIVAMFFIFYHGLTLGRELSVDWYRALWYLFGISLLISFIFNQWYDRKVKEGGLHGTK